MRTKSIAAVVLTALLMVAANALGADATVTAVGKFAFTNPETAVASGLRRAHIEMCDEDGWGICSVFATGETGDDGSFTLTGRSGDWFGDLPEVEVRVFATSAGVEVSSGTAVYCFKTRTQENATNGSTINFGTITPQNGRKCTFGESASEENGAWATYQWSREAFEFLRGSAAPAIFSGVTGVPGQGVSQQKVKWPAAESLFAADFSGFQVKRGDERSPGWIMNFYTIVVVTQRLGAWTSSYNDWDGYFAMVMSAMIAQYFGHRWDRVCLTADPTVCGTLEVPPHSVCQIGGMKPGTAAIGIYWDLYDSASDGDHDWNGSADRMQVPLDLMWSIVRDYDPNPNDPRDNHPDDVQQFAQRLLQLRPADEALLSEIFDENHLVPPWQQ